jgi:hypothetical protein
MPTASVRSYTDMRCISYHLCLVFIAQLILENMWILNLQIINPENISKSLHMLFNNNGHGWIITDFNVILGALTFQLCKPQTVLISIDRTFWHNFQIFQSGRNFDQYILCKFNFGLGDTVKKLPNALWCFSKIFTRKINLLWANYNMNNELVTIWISN